MQLKHILQFVSIALAAVHTVDVGESGLAFQPQTLTASAGDMVIFTLHNGHNVAQSSFDKPCANDGGFFSGSFSADGNGAMRFVLTVHDTNPIYYYCSLPTHCQSGMVGGINVPSDGNTIAAYASAAGNTGNSVVPPGLSGGVLVSEAEASSLENPSATPSPTMSSAASSSEAASEPTSSSMASSMESSAPSSTGSAGSSSAAATGSPTGGSAAATGSPTGGSSSPTSSSAAAFTGAAAVAYMDTSAAIAGAAGLLAWFL